MFDKFIFLVKESLKTKIKTKWFLIVNIIFLVVISLILNIDSVISFFGGD